MASASWHGGASRFVEDKIPRPAVHFVGALRTFGLQYKAIWAMDCPLPAIYDWIGLTLAATQYYCEVPTYDMRNT